MNYAYLRNGETLRLDAGRCVGCGACVDVCPHGVFSVESGKAAVRKASGCMECGACSRNCPAAAITVKPGVGCASAIILGKLRGTEPSCDCGKGGSKSCC